MNQLHLVRINQNKHRHRVYIRHSYLADDIYTHVSGNLNQNRRNMNIFKKLFGKSNQETFESKNENPNLKKPDNLEDLNTRIINLDNYICELCEWGDKIENLSDAQKNFYFNQNLEREINNGGFHQYFYNSSGDYANETIQSLKKIKADKTAEILMKAINQFPDKSVPKDRDKRQEIIEKIEEESTPIWEELEQIFYKYEDDLNTLNMEYVKSNEITT